MCPDTSICNCNRKHHRDQHWALAVNLDRDADVHKAEQLFHIVLAHADAAMRCRLADGTRRVRAMDTVALSAQSQPTCTQRVVFSRRHNFARTIPGRLRDAIDDPEFALRARRRGLTDRDIVDLENTIAFEEHQLAVRNRNDDPFALALLWTGIEGGDRQDRRQLQDWIRLIALHAPLRSMTGAEP